MYQKPLEPAAALKAKFSEIHGEKKKSEEFIKQLDEACFASQHLVILDGYYQQVKARPEVTTIVQQFFSKAQKGGKAREEVLEIIDEGLEIGKKNRDEAWEKLKNTRKFTGEEFKDLFFGFYSGWAFSLRYEIVKYQISNPMKIGENGKDEGLKLHEEKFLVEFKKRCDALPRNMFLPIRRDGV
jgi:hypothetical protein